MVKRRMSAFSRVVAFITAMAMAMLVVTVAHREVISAETGEDLVQTVSANEAAQLYSGIQTYADAGSGTYLDATKHIEVQKAVIYLNGSELQPDTVTNIGDGQKLALELEWYIPADKDGDFSGKTFAWDITEQIHGIVLESKEYSVKENGKVIATYRIENGEDGTTMMYITPKKGFDSKHFNKRGSIMLNGVTSVDKITNVGEGEEPYIKFFDAEVKVNVPDADTEVYVQKAAGDIRKDGNDYYQKFTVIVYNNTGHAADTTKTLLVDKPGSVFLGDPINATFYYSNYDDSLSNENEKYVGQVTNSPDGKYFEIAVGSLSGHSSVVVDYELKLDASKLLSGETLSVNDKSNTVYIEENPEDERDPQTVGVNIKKLEPSIGKSGTYDQNNDTITWKITVSPNYFEDKNFTVTDTIDDTNSEHNFVIDNKLDGVTVSADGKTITIGKDKFKPNENGQYTFEYTTAVPSSVAGTVGLKKFVNKAEAKFDDSTKTYEKTASVEVKSKFLTKKFKQLNGNTFMWEVDLILPEGTTYIDFHDGMGSSQYASGKYEPHHDMFRYSLVKVINADGSEYRYDPIIGTAFIYENGYGVWPDNGSMGIAISDTSFLEKNSGKKIKIVYGIELIDGYDIDLLSRFGNSANCTITHSGDTANDNDTAEYTADVTVTKRVNDWNIYTHPIFAAGKDEYGHDIYDNDLISEVENPNRCNKIWMVSVSFPNGLELNQPFKIADRLEGDVNSYFYTGDLIEGKPKLWVVGLSNDDWGTGFTMLGEGNEVEFNTIRSGSLIFDVTINNEEDLDAINNGKYLTLMYHTSMSEDYYTSFNTDDKPVSFTNVAEVSINNGEKKYIGKKEITVVPDNRIFDKDGTKIGETDDVEYTLYVNKDSLMLGAADTDPVITDRIGARLKLYESTITINGQAAEKGTDYTFDSENNVLKFINLKDRTSYEIKYKARINEYLGPTETIIDDARKQYYGNDATISFGNSDGTTTKKFDSYVLGLNDVRGSATIESDPNELKINFTKLWDGWDADNQIPSESILVKVTGKLNNVTEDERAQYPDKFNDVEKSIAITGDKSNNTWSAVASFPSKVVIPAENDDDDDIVKYYTYEIKEVKLSESILDGSDYTVAYSSDVIDVSMLKAGADNKYETDVTITNTRTPDQPTPVPEKINITVNKMWYDDGHEAERSDTVTVNIYRSDGIVYPVTLGDTFDEDGNAIWYKTIEVPKTSDDGTTVYTYTAEEEVAGVGANYTSSISPDFIKEADGTFIVENTYNDPGKPKMDITVVKIWEEDDLPYLEGGNPKNSRGIVTVNIYKGDELVKEVKLTAANATADDNVWSKSVTITKPENDGEYDAKEVGVGNKYEVSNPITIVGTDTEKTVTVTNKYKREKINISVTKKWVDKNNTNIDENRSATVKVYRGISEDSCNELVGTLVLSESDSLTKSLDPVDKYDDTGKLYIYKVVETPIPTDYEFLVNRPFISGEDGEFIVTNTYKDKEESSSLSETEPPTQSQTEPPTQSQTEPPTQSQTEPPTQSQTEPPTQSQTEPPTQSQTEPPTQSQTEPPTQSQTEPPTQSQTEPPTQSQTEPPTQSQTEPPTQSQTEPPTQSQTEPPTQSQTEPVIPSESVTSTEPGTPNNIYDPGTSYIPNAPTVPGVPTYPNIPFTPVVTTAPATEPVVTTPVHEEVIEDEEIEYEDVSSAAEIFDDTDEAVKRDNILIIILVAIIIIGNSILFYRSKTVDADRKYRM